MEKENHKDIESDKNSIKLQYQTTTSGNGHVSISSTSSLIGGPGKSTAVWSLKKCIIVAVCTGCIGLGIGLTIGFTVNTGNSSPSDTSSTTTTAGPSSSLSPSQGCYTSLQHLTNGLGNIPNTTGETFRSMECPTPGQYQCPDGINPSVILISLDGFRADYLLRKMTPNIERMTECGAHAPFMRAAFPTKTFPNHYTLVTGLYPETHGMIDNSIFDIKLNKSFSLRNGEPSNKDWWGGEPIWNTVKKEGKKAYTMFWPGSEADIQDMRPDKCYAYDGSVTEIMKIKEVMSYFDGDKADAPDFITLYFDEPDYEGHNDPFSADLDEKLAEMDGYIGTLMDGFIQRKLENCVNVIIVADHGMAPVACDDNHKVYLSDYHDPSDYYIFNGVHSRFTSRYKPGPGGHPVIVHDHETPEEMVAHYDCSANDNKKDWNVKFYSKYDLPKRYHFCNHDRIDEVVLDIAEGYSVYRQKSGSSCLKGNHGYNNNYKSMHALFVAHGPGFKHQPAMQMFDNIEIYNLMADLLDIKDRAPNNGTYGRLHNIQSEPGHIEEEPAPASNYGMCPFPEQMAERDDRRSSSDCTCPNMQNFTSKTIDEVDQQLDLSAQEVDSSIAFHLPLGVPQLDWENANVCRLVQQDYVSGFNHDTHMPDWVSFKLNKRDGWSVLDGKYRTDMYDKDCVRADVRLEVNEQIPCAAYRNASSGISPGFLYPPGFSYDPSTQLDGHISTNICPMYDQFRKGIWRETMILLEDYSEKYGQLQVTLGPIFDYDSNGHRDSLQTINDYGRFTGPLSVPIPTHYFVTVIREKVKGEFAAPDDTLSQHEVISVILPHKPTIGNCMADRSFDYLTENTARVMDISLLTNLRFFPILNSTLERIRVLTYLPDKLWSEQGWMDLLSYDDDDKLTTCPDISEAKCPSGYDENHPPTLLISIDGYKYNYFEKGKSKVLDMMRKCGVSTPYLRSVHPSNTFPNHYTQVTGCYPEINGIVDNNMYDIDLKEGFSIGSKESGNSHWWLAEPIWNTFVKQNKTAMTMFWTGSDVEIGGIRPTQYYNYSSYYPNRMRIKQTLDWLSGKNGTISDLVTLYFSDIDSAGHEGGPDSYQVDEALANLDVNFNQLMDGLYKGGLLNCVNIIVVSDHGMGDMKCESQIMLNTLLPNDVLNNMYVYQGPAARIATNYKGGNRLPIDPQDQENQEDVINLLQCQHPSYTILHKNDLPVRVHYVNSKRIDDLNFRSNEPWMVQRFSSYCPIPGYHGWEPNEDNMKGIFMAYGNAFKSNYTSDSFENIEIYNLIAHLGGVQAAPNNGTEGSLYHMLRNQPTLPTPPSHEYTGCEYPNDPLIYAERSNLSSSSCRCDVSNRNKNIKEYDEQLNLTSQQKVQVERIHLPQGMPLKIKNAGNVCVLHHQDFVSGYSHMHKLPLWTAFTLAQDKVSLNNSKVECQRPDVRLSQDEQRLCDVYSETSQHNISSESMFSPDFSASSDASLDSKVLTNLVPMYSGFKSGIWQYLSSRIVDWTKEFKKLHIIVGPIFDGNRDGLVDINSTQTIDGTDIPFASHFYAVLLKCPSGDCAEGDYDMQAFILHHKQNITNCMTSETYLRDSIARVRDVELLTGFQFGPFTQVGLRRKIFIPMHIWDLQRLR